MKFEDLLTYRKSVNDKEHILQDQLEAFTNYYANSEKNRIERGEIDPNFDIHRNEKLLQLKLMKE